MLTCRQMDVPVEPGPQPQVTSELGCTLTGPSGSTPVTISSSGQLIPTAAQCAWLAADVDVPGAWNRGAAARPRHRGHHLASKGLPQRPAAPTVGGQLNRSAYHDRAP